MYHNLRTLAALQELHLEYLHRLVFVCCASSPTCRSSGVMAPLAKPSQALSTCLEWFQAVALVLARRSSLKLMQEYDVSMRCDEMLSANISRHVVSANVCRHVVSYAFRVVCMYTCHDIV